MLTQLPFGTTVTVLRSVVSGRDAYGNDQHTQTPVVYPGCAVLNGSVDETSYGRTASQQTRIVVLPDGAVVNFTDQVQLDDGSIWDVDGPPQQQISQLTGARGGLWVHLRQTSG